MADSRSGAANGSRLYELNVWMLCYCRGQPRRVTDAKAELQRKAELQLKAAISNARTGLQTLRDERGGDYYRQRLGQQALDASDGSASD